MCSIIGYIGANLSEKEVRSYFERTVSRGPDMTRILNLGNGFLGFHRLAIMGLNESGMQPFSAFGNSVVCNGELYGFRLLKKKLEEKGYTFQSESDCELLLPLYREYGTDMFRMLDAEFAMILYDGASGQLIAARDPIGIRPLYYGYLPSKEIIFASEPKNLVGLCRHILPFPPGHYYKDGKFVCYRNISKPTALVEDDVETACKKIHDKLEAGILKRLDADAPVGFLLSGGLDSSLVCAVAARHLKSPSAPFPLAWTSMPST